MKIAKMLDVDGILCQPTGGRGAFAPPAGNRPSGACANRGRGGRCARSACRQIPGLKTLEGRTYYVGPDAKFPPGCRSCLLGTGLSAIRKTNKCNAQCKFCYDYGVLDRIAPIGEGYWEIGGSKFREEDIDLLLSIHRAPTGISICTSSRSWKSRCTMASSPNSTRRASASTCTPAASLVDMENLRAPGERRLDELRFKPGATVRGPRDRNMRLARRPRPAVGIKNAP